MKKIIALLLVMITVFSLCAACGNKQQQGAQAHSGVGADGRKILTIGLPADARILSLDDNALTKWLEEKTGYDLRFQPYSGGSDVATQLATAVAADQTLPDVLIGISLGDDVISRYGKDGYFVDLQDYYADRDGASKTFWDRLESTFSKEEQENILRLMTDPEDGAMYSVPTLETSLVDTMDYQMWVNQTWLDECNLEAPTNLDELYNVLVTFKNKYPGCVPLYGSGSRDALLGADVVNWLINNFIYFNDRKNWNVTDDGVLYAPFTTDEYREALKFVNKLVREGLMLNSVFNTKTSEMKQITTPANGKPMVGIFAGHLTLHAQLDSEVLYNYTNLAPFEGQYCVYNDNTNRRQNFITEDCVNQDEAFNFMMTMWSEEASYRIRYGMYGVNWTDPDAGAKSDLGLDATIKILRDPLMEQNDVMWGAVVQCTLLVYSEGETAQSTTDTNPWLEYKSKLHATSRKLFDEAAAKNNPKNICPSLVFTENEKEETEAIRLAVSDYYKKASTDFMTGKMDPNNQAQWNNYLKTLNDHGLQEYLALAQEAYDRQ